VIRGEGSLERLAWRQRPGVGRDSDPTTRKPLGLELPVRPQWSACHWLLRRRS
jgi:hypothetical protein